MAFILLPEDTVEIIHKIVFPKTHSKKFKLTFVEGLQCAKDNAEYFSGIISFISSNNPMRTSITPILQRSPKVVTTDSAQATPR